MRASKELALSALFVSLMLVLGYIETMLPTGPIPGIKLGLSNSVLLLCLYWLGVPQSFSLMLSKVLLSALMFAGFNSLMFSLSGGLLSMLGMWAMVYGLKGVSPVGAGILGGVLHNVAQVGVAMLVMTSLQSGVMLYYMAVLVVVGAVMGGLTGSVVVSLKRFLPYQQRVRFGFIEKKKEPAS